MQKVGIDYSGLACFLFLLLNLSFYSSVCPSVPSFAFRKPIYPFFVSFFYLCSLFLLLLHSFSIQFSNHNFLHSTPIIQAFFMLRKCIMSQGKTLISGNKGESKGISKKRKRERSPWMRKSQNLLTPLN